jgi:biotin operon repressor
MSLWTDEEIRGLISLWPVASATQIADRLHRSRSAVCRMVARLRQEGVLPSDVESISG